MGQSEINSYTEVIKDLMGEKTHILSKAHVLSEMGMLETAKPLWRSAAVYEESIAPLLDGLGQELEAAVHRISAASCYQKAGDLIRAVNLSVPLLLDPYVVILAKKSIKCSLTVLLNWPTSQLDRSHHPMYKHRQLSCKMSVMSAFWVETVT